MKTTFRLFPLFAILATAPALAEQQSPPDSPPKEIVYKTIGDVQLKLHVFEPSVRDGGEPLPAIVFFFGGGWVNGSPKQFFPHCQHLAERGMFAASAEYRIRSKHGTSPFECVADGKSAVRWIRAHAAELGVDPNRIAAGGGSAGGHVAACAGVIPNHEEPGENANVSSLPDAMVLFNPVVDTTGKGYGQKKLEGRETEISPVHHVRPGLAPTIIFHGTADTTVPFENVERFAQRMKEANNECELIPFPDKKHGFFNFDSDGNATYESTVKEMDRFLTRHGFIHAQNNEAKKYTLENCITAFNENKLQKSERGWAYWFAAKELTGGLNLKMSEVKAHTAHHGSHVHPEAEIFFILEGTAEFTLEGKTEIVEKNTSLFCPPNVSHGIRNAGDAPMRYFVIKSN